MPMPPNHQRATDEAPPLGYISMEDASAMISARVAEAMASMSELLVQKTSAPGGDAINDLARTLATAIAEANNKGKRNAVSIEEMEKREAARVALFDMISDLNERGEVMEYRLSRKVVLEDANGPQLIEPLWQHPVTKRTMHTTLTWADVPNEAMEPVNDNAKRVFDLFAMWIGGVKKRHERLRLTPRGVVITEGSRASNDRGIPPVAGPKANAALSITGRGPRNEEMVTTNVLGTVAKPAMQINGRAAA